MFSLHGGFMNMYEIHCMVLEDLLNRGDGIDQDELLRIRDKVLNDNYVMGQYISSKHKDLFQHIYLLVNKLLNIK